MAETSQNRGKFLTLEIKQESSDFFFSVKLHVGESNQLCPSV